MVMIEVDFWTSELSDSQKQGRIVRGKKEKSEKAGLKLNIQKTKIMASGSITSWQIDGENGNSDRLYFPGLQNHCRLCLKT